MPRMQPATQKSQAAEPGKLLRHVGCGEAVPSKLEFGKAVTSLAIGNDYLIDNTTELSGDAVYGTGDCSVKFLFLHDHLLGLHTLRGGA